MQKQMDFDALPRFNGSDYDHARDVLRLTGQMQRVFDLMSDGKWRTPKRLGGLRRCLYRACCPKGV